MVLDPLSPVAPARVRCLLLPCGRVTRTRFLEFVKRLQNEAIVRLGDVSPSTKPEQNTFSPLAFPQGVIVFDLVVSDSSAGQRALYPFEIFREPLVVLGLADAGEYKLPPDVHENGESNTNGDGGDDREASLLSELSETSEGLRAVYNVALVHKVLLFDYEGTLRPDAHSILPVPTASKSTTTTVKTLMCDVVAELLVEMASYARSINALPSIETPKQSMSDGFMAPPGSDLEAKRQSWFPGSRSSSPGQMTQRLGQRASLPAHLFPSGNSSVSDVSVSSEASSPTTDLPATTFDQMSLADARRATQAPSRSHRTSGQAFTLDPVSEKARNQGRGRVGVVIGQMHLVAGRWPDALRELVHGGIIARSTNDHVWHAKAVDSILVTLLMCAWAGVDFEIPPLCLPIAERSSVLLGKSSKKSETFNINETFIIQTPTNETKKEGLKTMANVLPEIVHHIVRLYTRSTAETVSQLALAETFIRLSKLLTIALSSPDFSGSNALDAIVMNKPIKIASGQMPIVSLSSPVRAEIAAIALASMPSNGLNDMVSYSDRLAVHAGTATVLGMLGYHRKKAFILKELLSFLLPALEQGSNGAVSGLGMYSSPFLKSPDPSGATQGTSSTTISNAQPVMSDTIYDLLVLICQTYGAVTIDAVDDLDKRRLSRFRDDRQDDSSSHIDEGAMLASKIELDALTRTIGSRRLKMEVLFTCMSVCEIIPDLKGVVAFASSLLRTVGSGIAPGPQDFDGAPALSPDDQMRVAGAITHAASTASNIGIGRVQGEYWDDFIVRDVEILPINPDLGLTPRKRSELEVVKANLEKQQKQGPFIVNQFTPRNSTLKREVVLAKGEKFTFAILLQNLYDTNLEIDSLEIDAGGVQLDARLERFMIGPYKTQRLRLVAEALSSGQLSIRGCLVKVRDCNTRSYPIFREAWRPTEVLKLKRQGISSIIAPQERPTSTSSEKLKSLDIGKPTPSTLSATVTEAQPRLVLVSTSVPQDNVMVIEGERHTVTVVFKNVSSKIVDFVNLSFDDSTLSILKSAAQDRELPAADLYEVEYGIYKKSAISWRNPNSNISIQPDQDLTLQFDVLGKPGLTSGAVLVDYASAETGSGDSETFYTRRLSIQFAITVNPGVDLVRNDVFALTGPLAHHQHLAKDAQEDSDSDPTPHTSGEWTERLMRPVREQLAMPSENEDYCLILLDFYNSWTRTLMVAPEIKRTNLGNISSEDDGWSDVFKLAEAVDPGQSARFLVPVPRIALSDPYAPIPSLNPASKRQFVVSTGKISESYERSSRDAFWHREELLKLIRVRWTDPASSRSGWVELRAIRLTVRMLDALKAESLSMQLDLVGSDQISRIGPCHFRTAADEFVEVRTKLWNRSKAPVHPILRLQPALRNQPYNIALDLGRKFAFTGLLQQPLPSIQPGEVFEAFLPCVFLCSGEFEIAAAVEEIRVPEPEEDKAEGQRNRAASAADLDVLSTERKDRRIWFAKEYCKVDVQETEMP